MTTRTDRSSLRISIQGIRWPVATIRTRRSGETMTTEQERPVLVGPLSGGFEFVFGGPVGTAGLRVEWVLPELERKHHVWGRRHVNMRTCRISEQGRRG